MPKAIKAKSKEKVASKKVSQEEFEKMTLDFAKKGLTSEKIGESLRKQGIHPKEHGKKISEILKAKGVYVIPEIVNVTNKLEKIKKHFDKNKQDKRAMRDRERTFSKLRKIKSYHQVA